MGQIFDRIFFIAVLVEITTNCTKTLIPRLNKRYIPTIAGIIGIIVTWTTETGLLTLMEIPVQSMALDYILTGIIVSRGANIVHDIAKKLNF